MEDVPEGSPHLRPWLDALAARGLTVSRVIGDQCPRVTFAPTWEETEAALPPATRGKMRRRKRQLAERHGARLEQAGDPAQLDADVRDLMALHQERWTRAGQPGVFADARFAAFYRDAVRGFARQGRYRLNFLRVDGRRVAAVSGFRQGDEFHFHHGGLGDAGAASRYSPGIALHLLTMEAAHAEGVRTYDLLRGTEQYKGDLGGVPQPTWRVTVAGRPGGIGRWLYLVSQVQVRGVARIDHERRLLAGLREDPGPGRLPVVRHLAGRAGANLRDVVRRLRSPW
jgi:CelD/BcsL family acetyltransferase involved in cellulose biosynthesis